MGNNTEFEKAMLWLSDNLTFDVDARINLFECNIRVLGGLVSAHILATDSTNRLTKGTYRNQLLVLAEELGLRFLPAFDTPTGLPYAWIFICKILKINLCTRILLAEDLFEYLDFYLYCILIIVIEFWILELLYLIIDTFVMDYG